MTFACHKKFPTGNEKRREDAPHGKLAKIDEKIGIRAGKSRFTWLKFQKCPLKWAYKVKSAQRAQKSTE